jgi:curli biogenesis system outer membrane secretion channel CsgG
MRRVLLGQHGNRTESVIGLTIRVIDVRSGEVVATATTEGVASRRNVSLGAVGLLARGPGGFGFSSGASGSREALLDEAMQDAVYEAAVSLVKSVPRLRAPR